MEPVFIMIVAAAWSGMSVYMERMIAISSTCWPRVGKTSLTSVPLLPVFENLKGDANAVALLSPGIGLSSYLSRAGFGSQVPMCEGAPEAKMCSTRFALGAKWGSLGVNGEKERSAAAVSGAGNKPIPTKLVRL